MDITEVREQLVDVLSSIAHPSSSVHLAREAAFTARYFLHDPAFSYGDPWENCENAAIALLAGAKHLSINDNAKETAPIIRTTRQVAKEIFKTFKKRDLRLFATHPDKFPRIILTITDTVTALALTYDKAAISKRTQHGMESDLEKYIGKLCVNTETENFWHKELCDPTVPEDARLHIDEAFHARSWKINLQTPKR